MQHSDKRLSVTKTRKVCAYMLRCAGLDPVVQIAWNYWLNNFIMSFLTSTFDEIQQLKYRNPNHNSNIHKMYKHVCTHKNIDRYALLSWQAYALVNLYKHVYEVTCAKRRHHRRRQATASQRILCDANAYILPRDMPPAPNPSHT